MRKTRIVIAAILIISLVGILSAAFIPHFGKIIATITVQPAPNPQDKNDCKNDGWMNFTTIGGRLFEDKRDCINYVEDFFCEDYTLLEGYPDDFDSFKSCKKHFEKEEQCKELSEETHLSWWEKQWYKRYCDPDDAPGGNNELKITSKPIEKVDEGGFYEYQVITQSENGSVLSYSLKQVPQPNFLKINSSTGLVTGNVPNYFHGNAQFEATITVTDGETTATQKYILTVVDNRGKTSQSSTSYIESSNTSQEIIDVNETENIIEETDNNETQEKIEEVSEGTENNEVEDLIIEETQEEPEENIIVEETQEEIENEEVI